MNRRTKRLPAAGIVLVALLAAVVGAIAEVPLDEFDRALRAMPLETHDRILAAIDAHLSSPGFPADELYALIERLATTVGPTAEKEAILLMLMRALESELSLDGFLPAGHDLAGAIEEGLSIEGIVLEALKGIAQRSPTAVIVAGITRRLTLLRDVRDLLFSREIFRTSIGSTQAAPTALPAARFDELVVQIADAISDYLEGGGSPFDGAALYELVAVRLRRLPEAVVRPEDVDLVLDRIGPPDLTSVALNALS